MMVRMLIFILWGIAAWPGSSDRSARAQDIPDYRIDLRLDLTAQQMIGRATVDYPAEAVRDGAVRFDVSLNDGTAIDVLRATDPDGADLGHSRSKAGDTVTIRVPEGAGTLHIEYRFGVPVSRLEQFGYYAFAPFGSSSWAYPDLLDADGSRFHFSDFDVTLTHPSTLGVLTTGGDGARTEDHGVTTANYAARHVEGFAIVAGEGFTVSRHERGGASVVAFYHPEYAERFDRVVEHTVNAAAWYSETYGFFPLDQIGIIQGHPRWGGGYPLPNVFAVHLGNLDDDFLTWITAHELGHYYWGLYVLGESERLSWLQLGLGIWADQLYLADLHGRTLSEQWRNNRGQGSWISRYLQAAVADRELRLDISEEEESALRFDYNSLVRHAKGATGIYLMSLLLGKDRFLDLQKELLTDYRHRPLPEADFVRRLQEAGVSDAPDFFAAWKRADASIGASIDAVEPADEGWLVTLRRTGTVPYPIGVELLGADGTSTRHVMPAEASSDTLWTLTAPSAISLDPDGRVPMWNSAHPDMQRQFVRAFEAERLDEPFIAAATRLLETSPNDYYVRYRLARRLFFLGRWSESEALWPAGRGCDMRDACLAALYASRSSARSGRSADARIRLNLLRDGAARTGLSAFWQTVWDETER